MERLEATTAPPAVVSDGLFDALDLAPAACPRRPSRGTRVIAVGVAVLAAAVAGTVGTQRLDQPISAAAGPIHLGAGRIWPAEGEETATADSGSQYVAEHFAVVVLGLTNPVVTVDPTAPPNGPATVTISEPGGSGSVRVLTAPMRDGSWAVMQVGDGLLYSNERHAVSFVVPSGAANALAFVRTAKGTDRSHHTVGTGSNDVPVSDAPLSTVAIFRNASGEFVGATGGHFGFPG